jgi:hypothetical protein
MNSNLNEIRLVKKQQLNPQLECSVYYHLFHIVGRELFPVWTYVTSGLFAHKQKEMIFVLKCLPEEKAEDFPCAPLSLFKIIFDYARQGVIVDQGIFLSCFFLVFTQHQISKIFTIYRHQSCKSHHFQGR